MFKLLLHAKECISCGICIDVCVRGALRLRVTRRTSVEGAVVDMGTFPQLQERSRCDGCMLCVRECPVSAIEIVRVKQNAA